MRAPARGEQGRAAWCARLLFLAALIAGIVTMHTFGHPAAGHGGHATLSAAASAPTGPMDAAPRAAASPDTRPTAGADGCAMDPGSVCLAVLSVWSVDPLVPPVTGPLAAAAAAALLAVLRATLLRRPRPIPPPPRRELLARLSVLRV